MPRKTALRQPAQPERHDADPPLIRVGLPAVPALYGLKERKQYLPWSHARERLERSHNYWICTTRPDGRPHSIPVWGFFLDDVLYFGTARSSRKGRNLSGNPAVSVHLESGDDVVILEGTAREVTGDERATLVKLNAASKRKYKEPLTTIPGESVIYAVRPRLVLSWTENDFPNNATRWQFEVDRKGDGPPSKARA